MLLHHRDRRGELAAAEDEFVLHQRVRIGRDDADTTFPILLCFHRDEVWLDCVVRPALGADRLCLLRSVFALGFAIPHLLRGDAGARGLRLRRGHTFFRAVLLRLSEGYIEVVDLGVVIGHGGRALSFMVWLAEPYHLTLV